MMGKENGREKKKGSEGGKGKKGKGELCKHSSFHKSAPTSHCHDVLYENISYKATGLLRGKTMIARDIVSRGLIISVSV